MTAEDYASMSAESYADSPEVRAENCCAIEHPLNWTASTGEQFTITQPVVRDGAIYLVVNVERDGAVIHSDDHYIHGLVDFVTIQKKPYRDWVIALQNMIEMVTL